MDRPYWIIAHRADGTQIPGTEHGQAVLRCKNYKRTLAYKRIKSTPANQLCASGDIPAAYYTVQVNPGKDYFGHLRVIEIIRK